MFGELGDYPQVSLEALKDQDASLSLGAVKTIVQPFSRLLILPQLVASKEREKSNNRVACGYRVEEERVGDLSVAVGAAGDIWKTPSPNASGDMESELKVDQGLPFPMSTSAGLVTLIGELD